MKIVILDGHVLNPGDLSWEGFHDLGNVVVYDRTPNDLRVERIADAEVILTNKVVIDASIINACKNLKYIGVLATGYDIVDVEAARKAGIIVTNIPAYGTDAVAQHTIALILELCNQVGCHSTSVKDGEWSNCVDWCYWKKSIMDLSGKTLGIIGYGRIGQKTSQIAQAMGMNVIYYSAHEKKELENERCKYADLEKVLSTSDVISLHCPLFDETQGIINKESIEKMKQGVLIINTSRGALIVEEDLKEALVSGKVGGAGLDVVCGEPISENSCLLTAPNIFITPHIAWASKEARQKLMNISVSNVKGFIDHKPQNTV